MVNLLLSIEKKSGAKAIDSIKIWKGQSFFSVPGLYAIGKIVVNPAVLYVNTKTKYSSC